MNRKTFIKQTAGGMALMGFAPAMAAATGILTDEPAPVKIGIVKEFVAAGHKDLPRVKEMLNDYPNLIFARYDWGNSDFEEAIEGAGHLGNKEIAEYLIGQGARVNLFVLTMLGKSQLVIPVLEAYPSLVFAKGPHGFTLLHHAKVGQVEDMQEYLLEKGLDKTFIKIK
jgi:ankyrin repeat protein